MEKAVDASAINEAVSIALAAYNDYSGQVERMASKIAGHPIHLAAPEEDSDEEDSDEDLEFRMALRYVDAQNQHLSADAPHADRRKAVPEDWYYRYTAVDPGKIPAYDPKRPKEDDRR